MVPFIFFTPGQGLRSPRSAGLLEYKIASFPFVSFSLARIHPGLSFSQAHPSIIMCRGSAWLVSLAGAAALSNALSLEKRDNPAVLALPFFRDQDSLSKVSKRLKTVGVSSDKNHDDYYLKVGLKVNI